MKTTSNFNIALKCTLLNGLGKKDKSTNVELLDQFFYSCKLPVSIHPFNDHS